MFFFESEVEYKECACDAIGYPIIPYDDYKNDVELEAIKNSGKCLRPWIFETSKTLVILIDISNIFLDSILVVNLSLMDEHGYAALMGFMTSLSLAVSIWMKFLMYRMRKDEVVQPECILQFVLITELFIFAFEDVTTILILTRGDGGGNFLIDHSEMFGTDLNLRTTILSGVCIVLLLLINISLMIFEMSTDWQSCKCSESICTILPSFAGMLSICYMLYFAIDKVLLENPMKDEEELYLKQTYIMNMVILFILLLLSNVVVYYMYIFSGGN